MTQPKRTRLTERQEKCLLMIGDHGLIGAHTEFSTPQTRRTVHGLCKKKLVQWIENRWILTRDGHSEWMRLVMHRAKRETA